LSPNSRDAFADFARRRVIIERHPKLAMPFAHVATTKNGDAPLFGKYW